MQGNPKRILVVYDHREPEKRLTIKHHLTALELNDHGHDIVYYNSAEAAPGWGLNDAVAPPPASLIARRFDAVILHYAFLALRTTGHLFYKWKQAFEWIKLLDCPKIAIPQDEADHAGLLDEWLFEWGVDAVLSVHYEAEGPLYPRTRTRARMYRCLPGYIDDTSAQDVSRRLLPLAVRPYDIVYRARRLPYWYGSQGQLKHQLAEHVILGVQRYGMRCDISTRTENAVVGDQWLDFLASGRAAIGGEGGLTTLDWTGESRAQMEALLLKDPAITFEHASTLMPKGWDSYRFLTITPRHFEAVVTKTCQILVEGEYRGILEAGKHYIPLKKDFSNLDDALEQLRDDRLVEDMVERAYEDVYLSGKYSYRTFAKLIEQAMDDQQTASRMGGPMEQSRERDAAVAALERQLIAERHSQALLRAQLEAAQTRVRQAEAETHAASAIRTDFEVVRSELRAMAEQLRVIQGEGAELRAMAEQLRALQARVQVEEAEVRTQLDELRRQVASGISRWMLRLSAHPRVVVAGLVGGVLVLALSAGVAAVVAMLLRG